jgi:hypothetical protein
MDTALLPSRGLVGILQVISKVFVLSVKEVIPQGDPINVMPTSSWVHGYPGATTTGGVG